MTYYGSTTVPDDSNEKNESKDREKKTSLKLETVSRKQVSKQAVGWSHGCAQGPGGGGGQVACREWA